MKGLTTTFKSMTCWTIAAMSCAIGLIYTTKTTSVEAFEGLGGPPHIGTFEGSTTFTTTSSNGINPGLYLEVMDAEGNYTEYTSEEGIITISNTKEGAYVTQAKLLGITKYKDQQTGEILDRWEEGRDLQLVSSEGPGLTTTGKNLFDGNNLLYNTWVNSEDPDSTGTGSLRNTLDFTKVEPGRRIVANGFKITGAYGYDSNKKFIVGLSVRELTSNGVIIPSTVEYIRLTFDNTVDFSEAQIEYGSVATPYESYQSNHLTINEALELRGVGEVRDTLNLITGERVERTANLNDWDNVDLIKMPNYGLVSRYDLKTNIKPGGEVKANLFNKGVISTIDLECVNVHSWSNLIQTQILTSKLSEDTVIGFKEWAKNNNYTLVYELATSTSKTLAINSTYYFEPVLNREVRVNGTVLPLVASVTIPTEPLSFLLDPNQDEGQQFIAPEFSITNNTPTSIYLNLKNFEQITNVFRDVLPTTYSDWSQLDKQQSKDMALALVPIPSEGWLSLDEGPRYVADTSNYVLGEVKKRSTVDFTFSALHGQSFIEELNPKYRLAFEFGFKN